MNLPHASDDLSTPVLTGTSGSFAASPNRATLTVSAPAKINWVLDLLERRPDGFHELETVASAVTLADELTITDGPDGSAVSLTCTDPSLPTDASNLAHRAATRLARRAGICGGVSIHLTKHIPAGAGLGGGSSDAAAVLRALNRLWALNWSLPRLIPLAAAIGSDVPLLLVGGTAVARGRGEFVESIPFSWPGSVLIAIPGIHVPTPDVYADVLPDDLRGVSDAVTAFSGPHAGRRWTARDLLERCRNALEPAAFRRFPHLAHLHAELRRASTRPWRLCGSGSSMFTACDTPDEAADCATNVRARLGIRVEVSRLETNDTVN